MTRGPIQLNTGLAREITRAGGGGESEPGDLSAPLMVWEYVALHFSLLFWIFVFDWGVVDV